MDESAGTNISGGAMSLFIPTGLFGSMSTKCYFYLVTRVIVNSLAQKTKKNGFG